LGVFGTKGKTRNLKLWGGVVGQTHTLRGFVSGGSMAVPPGEIKWGKLLM